MTYVPRKQIIARVANKYEAIVVAALECRRINDRLRMFEETTDRKITTWSLDRLINGEVEYYDARERREQERSEAMLAAAEGVLEAPALEAESSQE